MLNYTKPKVGLIKREYFRLEYLDKIWNSVCIENKEVFIYTIGNSQWANIDETELIYGIRRWRNLPKWKHEKKLIAQVLCAVWMCVTNVTGIVVTFFVECDAHKNYT